MKFRSTLLRALDVDAFSQAHFRNTPALRMMASSSGKHVISQPRRYVSSCFLSVTTLSSMTTALSTSFRCLKRHSYPMPARTGVRFMDTLSSSSVPVSKMDVPLVPSPSSPNQPAQSGSADIAMRPLRKGDLIDVTITRIGYGGTSVGQINSAPLIKLIEDDLALPVYAPKGACPGDIIRCTVDRVRRRLTRPDGSNMKPPPDPTAPPRKAYIEAIFTEMLTPSAQSINPVRCEHFGHFKLDGGGCGGCSSMQIPYEMQLEQKNIQIQILYSNLTQRLDGVEVMPIIPCKETFNYRNKMEFTIGRQWFISKNKVATTPNTTEPTVISSTGSGSKTLNNDDMYKDFTIGLHVPARFDKVVEINQCHIFPAIGNDILQAIKTGARDMLLEPFDVKADSGYLRNVGIRTSTNITGKVEIMVNLITSVCEVPDRLVPLAERIKTQFPSVVCVVQNMRGASGRGSQDIDVSAERLLVGDRSYIEQSINGITYRISSNSFFQTNPKQAAVLFSEVIKAAKLSTEDDIVLDLFCGTGSIGLSLARHAKHVYGIDIVSSAIEDATVNATVNGITNASFTQMNLEKVKEMLRKGEVEFPVANVVVVDPPRAGLHPDLVKYLAKADHVDRIVYVSCNPLSQIRDILELMHLAPDTFVVSSIQPVDMFPNTHHVESVVAIERRDKQRVDTVDT